MKTKLHAIQLLALVALSTFTPRLSSVFAQGTAFNYQGRLNDSGEPSNGTYDLRFTIYDSGTLPGNIIAGPLTNSTTSISNGHFSVMLDFGGGVFTGSDRWIQLEVRTNGGGSFAALSPRQQVLPTPYAVMANSASNLLGALPASQLTGAISATNLTGTVSVAQLPSVVLTNNAANITLSGTFRGNGAGLINLTDVGQINVLDYGADPTGTNDSTPAFQAACNASTNGGLVIVPYGNYNIATPPIVLSNMSMILQGRASGINSISPGGPTLFTHVNNKPIIRVIAPFVQVTHLNFGGPYPNEANGSCAVFLDGSVMSDGLQEDCVSWCYATNFYDAIVMNITVHTEVSHCVLSAFVHAGIYMWGSEMAPSQGNLMTHSDTFRIYNNSIGFNFNPTWQANTIGDGFHWTGPGKYGVLPNSGMTNQIGIIAHEGIMGTISDNDVNMCGHAFEIQSRTIMLIGNNFESYGPNPLPYPDTTGITAIGYGSNVWGSVFIGNIFQNGMSHALSNCMYLTSSDFSSDIMLFNPSLFPVYTTNGTGFYPLPKVLATGVTNANTGIYVFDTLFVADAPQQTIATALVMSPNTLNYGAPLTVMGYRSINIGSDIDNQNTITTTSGHIGGIAGYGIGDNYGLMGIIGYDELGNIPIVHIGGGCWETYESARQIKFNTSLDGASEGNDQWEINENGQFLGLAATSCIITPAPISCNSVTNNGVVWLSNLPTNGNPSLWTAGLKNGSILCTTNGQMFVMSNGVALGPK